MKESSRGSSKTSAAGGRKASTSGGAKKTGPVSGKKSGPASRKRTSPGIGKKPTPVSLEGIVREIRASYTALERRSVGPRTDHIAEALRAMETMCNSICYLNNSENAMRHLGGP